MIAVIFELEVESDNKERYFNIAELLKSSLEETEGFISVERFQSTTQPNKFLSLSFWRDEAAVASWRNQTLHRDAQAKGREGIFIDYRLRVAQVLRDYGMLNRQEAPNDSRLSHE